MQTAAPSGSIAASEVTQRLCEGYFEFRALGPTAVKGLNAPVEVYEVVRAGCPFSKLGPQTGEPSALRNLVV